jgi:hypothetical protein
VISQEILDRMSCLIVFVISVANLVHIWMKFLAMFKSKFSSTEESAVRRISNNFFFFSFTPKGFYTIE